MEQGKNQPVRGRIKEKARISPEFSITLIKLGIITLVYGLTLTVGYFIYAIVR